MLAAFKLLNGHAKWLAGVSLILCSLVFVCLGWSMLYALSVFALFFLQAKKQMNKAESV